MLLKKFVRLTEKKWAMTLLSKKEMALEIMDRSLILLLKEEAFSKIALRNMEIIGSKDVVFETVPMKAPASALHATELKGQLGGTLSLKMKPLKFDHVTGAQTNLIVMLSKDGYYNQNAKLFNSGLLNFPESYSSTFNPLGEFRLRVEKLHFGQKKAQIPTIYNAESNRDGKLRLSYSELIRHQQGEYLVRGFRVNFNDNSDDMEEFLNNQEALLKGINYLLQKMAPNITSKHSEKVIKEWKEIDL